MDEWIKTFTGECNLKLQQVLFSTFWVHLKEKKVILYDCWLKSTNFD